MENGRMLTEEETKELDRYKPEMNYRKDFAYWKKQYRYFRKMEEDYLIPLIKIEDELIKIHNLDVNKDRLAESRKYGDSDNLPEYIEEAGENWRWASDPRNIYAYRSYRYAMQRKIFKLLLNVLPNDIVEGWMQMAKADVVNSYKVMEETFAYDYSIMDYMDESIDENRNKVDKSQYQKVERRFMLRPQYKLWQYFKDEKDFENHNMFGYNLYHNVVPLGGYYRGLGSFCYCPTFSQVKGYWDGYIAFHVETYGGWSRRILSYIAEGWIDSGIPVLVISKDFVDMIAYVVEKYALDVGFDKEVFVPQEFKWEELPEVDYRKNEGRKLLYKYGDECGRRDKYIS